METVKISENQQSKEIPANERKVKVSSTFSKGGGGRSRRGYVSCTKTPSLRRRQGGVNGAMLVKCKRTK